MTPKLIFAISAILLAAIVYTVAVFGERSLRVLKPWHLGLFWIGLIFDTTGTTLMSEIAGGWKWDIHGVTGVLAIALMLIHSVWATIVVILKNERALHSFHRFSIHVWALWMAALISGFVMISLK